MHTTRTNWTTEAGRNDAQRERAAAFMAAAYPDHAGTEDDAR